MIGAQLDLFGAGIGNWNPELIWLKDHYLKSINAIFHFFHSFNEGDKENNELKEQILKKQRWIAKHNMI
ncbi:hypothetical protein O9G_005341 [Rozella allomycis CSF55]|uniref:Uncharacterized protein n=1 Tax=Rozella allomycis (strain CSF55) TaxID=988480 RepID=A0A075B4K3_ROZAC|nr:hypothetical protein O9G_005341 [Rozella allomycis CSF55]|eukprot:EPZ36422.1 hypothetical protein O9G_005341 [Rozella allomycis CSF55]